LKKREENVARVIVGINTSNAKVKINLLDILEPTYPFFLSTQVLIILLITLKQRNKSNKISIVKVNITIVGVTKIPGIEFENTKNVIIDAKKDNIIKPIVIFLFVEGFCIQKIIDSNK
tara:strand:- start:8 stop:361 length:354 start_codon:yes stop_codon:yes gene_type:complete